MAGTAKICSQYSNADVAKASFTATRVDQAQLLASADSA